MTERREPFDRDGDTVHDGRGAPDASPIRRLGPYEILEELGRGGMGVVYRARHVNLDRTVALKVISAGQHASPELVERFRREARIAANLEHPNIVPVHEVGEEGGFSFFTMTLVEGISLAALLAEVERLPVRTALHIAADVARAIAHAHAHGVIHRDIKPANVLLACDEAGREPPTSAAKGDETTINLPGRGRTPFRVLVADFGLARQLEADGARLTVSGAVLGTPHYMAPEQAMGEPRRIGLASDVYAIGAVLYETLAGRPPFGHLEQANPFEILKHVMFEDPPPPRSLLAALAADVETIVMKCLEKDPARRYRSAGELGEDIRRYLAGDTILARPRSAAFHVWRWLVRRRAIVAPVVVVILALAAMAIHAATRPGHLLIRVIPPGARVTVAGETRVAGEAPLRFVVPPGRHHIAVELERYEAVRREEYVARRESRRLEIPLVRERGFVSIESEFGAAVLIDGARHGTPLVKRPLPTGRHLLWVESPGRYRRAVELDVHAGKLSRRYVNLPRAEGWRVQEPAWSPNPLLADIDGDGIADIVTDPYRTTLLVISGATGKVLWRTGLVTGNARASLGEPYDADGDGAIDWIVVLPLQGQTVPAAISLRQKKALWAIRGLRIVLQRPRFAGDMEWLPMSMLFVDLDRDGRRDLLLFTQEQELRAYSIKDGKLIWKTKLDSLPAWPPSAEPDRNGNSVPELRLVVGNRLVRLGGADGKILSRETLGAARPIPIPAGTLALGAGRFQLHLPRRDSKAESECWEITTRKLLWRKKLDLAHLDWNEHQHYDRLIDAQRDRSPVWIGTSADRTRLVLLEVATGKIRLDVAAGGAIERAPRPLLLQPGGRAALAFWGGRCFTLVDPALGKVLWKFDAPARVTCGGYAVDLDRDGRSEILAGTEGGHVFWLDRSGKVAYSILIASGVRDLQPVDLDADGILDLIAHTPGGCFGLRGPKVIWRRRMGGEMRVGPRILDVNGDGVADFIVAGRPHDAYWGIMAFDGASGKLLWVSREKHDLLRPPAVADLDGDGRPEILAWVQDQRLLVLDASTGRKKSEIAVGFFGYAEPVTADLDRDGVPDIVVHGWNPDGPYAAISGRTRRFLWRGKSGGPAWSGASLADATGDGTPDVFFANNRGQVLALDGATGKRLWRAQTRGQNRAGVALGRLGESGPLVAAVASTDGTLYLYDAQKGDLLKQLPGLGGTASRPKFVAVAPGGRTLILSGTARGLVLHDPASGRQLWRYGESAIHGEPAIADLDGDGQMEALAGTADGFLVCLDLATGKLRWRWNTGGGKAIEGAPAVADLDGDGILDAVVASHDWTVTAVSGRGRVAEK